MHVCAIPDPKLDIADFEQLGAVIVRDSNLENFEWSHWTFESL